MTAQAAASAKPRRRQIRRLIFLVIVGAVLVGTAQSVKCFWFNRPVGSGPVGIPVPRGPFDHTWTTQEVLLLGIGDSITDGFGARRGYSYFDRLVTNPADEFADMQGICLSTVLPNLQTRNDAVSCSTSIDHLQRLQTYAQPQPSETLGLIVITTGGNDIIHDYGRSPPCEGAMYGATLAQARPWIAAFEQRLRAMITHIEALFPGGCHIFLANIYDPTDGVGDAASAGLPPWEDALEILRAYNEIIARCAEEHPTVRLVDIHSAFLGHGVHCTHVWRKHYRWGDPHYWYYQNLEDPNERGYDAIRRLFLLEIAEVFAGHGGQSTAPAP